MRATRTVLGRPVNDMRTVVRKVVDLVAETLDQSPSLSAVEVQAELEAATAALGLLSVGGHLRSGELVLVAPGLRLRIDIPVGEDALGATEYLDPPRGAATATDWSLHLPGPDSLAAVVNAATRNCSHVSAEAAPAEAPPRQGRSVASTIDLSRLADMGVRR